MSFDALLIDTVTIFPWSGEGPTVDRYGNPQQAFDSPIDFPARVEQKKTAEALRDTDIRRITLLTDRDTRLEDITVFLPAAADAYVSALAELEWNGRRWKIVGEPNRLENSIGLHHIELVAENVIG